MRLCLSAEYSLYVYLAFSDTNKFYFNKFIVSRELLTSRKQLFLLIFFNRDFMNQLLK